MATSDSISTLTLRQMEMLSAIASHTARHGVSPTLAELRQALGLAPTTNVSPYLRPLYEQGYLEQPVGRYARRALKLTPEAMPVLEYLKEQQDGGNSEVTADIDSFR